MTTLRQSVAASVSPQDDELERGFEPPLIEALGEAIYEREQAIGAAMTLDETIELARSLVDPARDEPVETL